MLYRYIHDGIDILLITTLWYIYIFIYIYIYFGQVEVASHKMLAFELERWNLLSLRAEKQKFYNKTGNRSVCLCGNLDTEERAQGRIFGFLFWFGLLGPARMIQVWFVRISCHNPGSMLIDGVMVVPAPGKASVRSAIFLTPRRPGVGVACLSCWEWVHVLLAFLDSRFLSPFVESVTKDSFTAVAKDILNNNKDVVGLMAEGIQALQQLHPEQCDSTFVDNFLDQFLLNRIGSNVLLNQYLASVDKNLGWTFDFFDCAHFDDFDLLCYCFFGVFNSRTSR